MKKYTKYVVGIAVVTLLLPMVANADTISDLQKQIQGLLSQIQTLQNQIRSIRQASSTSAFGSTTPPFIGGDKGDKDDQGDQGENGQGGDRRLCVPLVRNIGIGSRGDDVRILQKMLAGDPTLYTGTTTGYFGPQTAQAVMKLQAKFGIASTTTGFIGELTRQFLVSRCMGMGIMPPKPTTKPPEDFRGGMMGSSTPQFPLMTRPNGGDR